MFELDFFFREINVRGTLLAAVYFSPEAFSWLILAATVLQFVTVNVKRTPTERFSTPIVRLSLPFKLKRAKELPLYLTSSALLLSPPACG